MIKGNSNVPLLPLQMELNPKLCEMEVNKKNKTKNTAKIGDWVQYTGTMTNFFKEPIKVEAMDLGRVATHYPDGSPYYMSDYIIVNNPNDKQLKLF